MRAAVFALLALALLTLLWQGMRPAPPVPAAASAAVATPASAPVRRYALDLRREPASTGTPLSVTAGEAVELVVTSAEDDELHLHGYDLVLPLKAGVPATMTFTATHAGRFEIELHHRHVEVAVLEVLPR